MRFAHALAIALGTAAALAPPAHADEAGRQAQIIASLIQRGAYQQADARCQSNLRPGQETLTRCAELYIEMGRLSEASAILPAGGNLPLLLANGRYRQASALTDTSEREAPHPARQAYRRSLHTLALLRAGQADEAAQLQQAALALLPRRGKNDPLYTPRTLLAACVIEAHQSNFTAAREHCRRAAALVPSPRHRTAVLHQLALAELHFLENRFADSLTAAKAALDQSVALFGPRHPDAFEALSLATWALLSAGDVPEAEAAAAAALQLADAIFPEGPKREEARTLADSVNNARR